jgi:hypothetical protein
MTNRYVWALGSEWFASDEHPTREAALAEGRERWPRRVIYTGVVQDTTVSEFIPSADQVLELMGEAAEDDIGHVGYWPEVGDDAVEDLEQRIRSCIESWAAQWNVTTDFFRVVGVERHDPVERPWVSVTTAMPPLDTLVVTKIDDADGVRNVQDLRFDGRLWFHSDASMYVYYTPTHWRYKE